MIGIACKKHKLPFNDCKECSKVFQLASQSNMTSFVPVGVIPFNGSAYKEKSAKIRPNLLPYEAVLEGIKAMEFGAGKYGPDQWREVDMPPVDFLNALERHLLAYKSGEKNAEDSGVSHLGHIIANCAILLVKFDLEKK